MGDSLEIKTGSIPESVTKELGIKLLARTKPP